MNGPRANIEYDYCYWAEIDGAADGQVEGVEWLLVQGAARVLTAFNGRRNGCATTSTTNVCVRCVYKVSQACTHRVQWQGGAPFLLAVQLFHWPPLAGPLLKSSQVVIAILWTSVDSPVIKQSTRVHYIDNSLFIVKLHACGQRCSFNLISEKSKITPKFLEKSEWFKWHLLHWFTKFQNYQMIIVVAVIFFLDTL